MMVIEVMMRIAMISKEKKYGYDDDDDDNDKGNQ